MNHFQISDQALPVSWWHKKNRENSHGNLLDDIRLKLAKRSSIIVIRIFFSIEAALLPEQNWSAQKMALRRCKSTARTMRETKSDRETWEMMRLRLMSETAKNKIIKVWTRWKGRVTRGNWKWKTQQKF